MTDEDDSPDGSEGGRDETGGAAAEHAPEAERDAGRDPDADSAAGTGSDADADSAAGTGSDADADSAADAGSHAETDTATEAASDAAAASDQAAAGGSDAGEDTSDDASDDASQDDPMPGVPEDVQKYERFTKMDGAQYERVNEFLRDRTYVTAREWAIARLCSDFRTETGVEMTKIGENLPELVPFMEDTYTPQAVNQARSSFDEKVRKAGATFLYGAMCDFYTAEELDDVMYEVTEVAKFLLEVEGVDLSVEEELEAEDRISSVMREVRQASQELREEDL